MSSTRKSLSSSEKVAIASVIKYSGMTLRDAELEFNVSKSTICDIMKLYAVDPTCSRRDYKKRARKTSTTDDLAIVLACKRSRRITACQIIEDLDLDVSRSTVLRRIHENGDLLSAKTQNKPLISRVAIKYRKSWAKENKNQPSEYWESVLFSDESPFELHDTSKHHVWKIRGEEIHSSHYNATVKHDIKLNVWGCFSTHGVGKIVRITGNMDAQQYVKILKGNLLQSAGKLFNGENFIFQQDNDPKHTSTLAQDWLASKGIDTMMWPPYSPDLNPIENLWSIVKSKIDRSKCHDEESLWEEVQYAWYNIPIDILESLVSSMGRRCQAVIDSKGLPTKY